MSIHQNKLQQLLYDLVAFESISPHDAGCQRYLAEQLTALGFTCTHYDCPPVANLYAQYGTNAPLLLFAGHTDVVPAGPLASWQSPPFVLTERNGQLFGRGVADMKGALSAMLIMAERLIQDKQSFKGSLGFLFTSGEEGEEYDKGTAYVMKHLHEQNIRPAYCIVGEPSSHDQVGDTIKIGRRGSLHAAITFQGKQGHVAYPHLARNPIHQALKALAALTNNPLDEGNTHFPPSSLQITHIQAGTGSKNLIPPELQLDLNIRYSTTHTTHSLKTWVNTCFSEHGLTPDIHWRLSGEPFLTAQGRLLDTTMSIIEREMKRPPVCSTSGGTSDGRFIAPYGIEVVELGLCHTSIHQVNESIDIHSLTLLAHLYEKISMALIK